MLIPAQVHTFAQVMARILAPAERPPHLLDWARRLKVRDETRQAISYRPELHPPQYFLLQALGDALLELSPYRRFPVIKPTQDGGTTIGQSAPQLYCAAVLGQPVIAGLPDMRLAGIQWRDKTQALILDSGLSAWLPLEGPGSEGASNPVEVMLNGRDKLYYMGAGASNEAGQAMITGRLLTRDEFDSMEPYLAELMIGRLDFFKSSAVVVDMTTIKHDQDSPIVSAWEKSTGAHIEYPCPHCKIWTWWRWEHVRADWSTQISAKATVQVFCPKCGVGHSAIEHRHLITLSNARLVMRGQQVNAAGVVEGAAPETLDWGLMWTVMDSPLVDLADLAAKFQDAREKAASGNDAPLRRFYRDRDCRAYVPEISDREISNTALKRQSDRSQVYKRIAPAWTSFLTMGQDAQGDRHYWLVLAWREDGMESAVIDWGYEYLVEVERDENGAPLPARPPTIEDRHGVLDRIERMRQEGWQIEGSSERLVPIRAGLDEGYLKAEILPWVQQHRTWVMVKGVGRDQAMRMDKTAIRGGKSLLPPVLAQALLGIVDVRQPEASPLPICNVNGHEMRLALQTCLMRQPGQAGHTWLPQGLRANDYLLLHLSAEVWTEEVRNGVGTGKWYWREVRRNQNHLLDCGTYAYALGLYHREVLRFQAKMQAAQPHQNPSAALAARDAITDLQRQRPHSRLLRR